MLLITAKSVAGAAMLSTADILASDAKAAAYELLDTQTLDPNGRFIAFASRSSSASACAQTFPGDINHDCVVDEEDLKVMADEWLSSDISARSNIDLSYTEIPGSASSTIAVDMQDYSTLAKDWRRTWASASARSSINSNSPIRNFFAKQVLRSIQLA
ncbi:MAG: hypothetical protein ACYTEL_06090 [Planctomycetota bacterium]|jgi:hypothetical protein